MAKNTSSTFGRAPQVSRSGGLTRSRSLFVGSIVLLVATLLRAAPDSESVVLNEITSVCGAGWIFAVKPGPGGVPVEVLRDALGIIYGGEFSKFAGFPFEDVVAEQHPSDVEAVSLLKAEEFRRALGKDVIAALSRVREARLAFYATAPSADANGDFLDSKLAKQYFTAQEEAEALLLRRFAISKSENGVDCE